MCSLVWAQRTVAAAPPDALLDEVRRRDQRWVLKIPDLEQHRSSTSPVDDAVPVEAFHLAVQRFKVLDADQAHSAGAAACTHRPQCLFDLVDPFQIAQPVAQRYDRIEVAVKICIQVGEPNVQQGEIHAMFSRRGFRLTQHGCAGVCRCDAETTFAERNRLAPGSTRSIQDQSSRRIA